MDHHHQQQPAVVCRVSAVSQLVAACQLPAIYQLTAYAKLGVRQTNEKPAALAASSIAAGLAGHPLIILAPAWTRLAIEA